jgi:hypothetical protein
MGDGGAHIHNALSMGHALRSIHKHHCLLDIAKDEIHVTIVSLTIEMGGNSVSVRMSTSA